MRNISPVVQVNGEDVTSDNHDGVVAKIKAMPDDAHLLVADALTYEHFKLSDDHPKSETELFIEVITCHDDAVEPGMKIYVCELVSDSEPSGICLTAANYQPRRRRRQLLSFSAVFVCRYSI